MREFYFEVKVGGVSILSGSSASFAVRPGSSGDVISITINDTDGEGTDTASLTLDNRDARIFVPQKNDPVVIKRGRSKAGMISRFIGYVSGVTLAGGGGGRTISVNCESGDPSGKAKEPLQISLKDKTIEDALSLAAKEVGLQTPIVDDAFKSIKREKEVFDGETFMDIGHRFARELGGKFKFFGDIPMLLSANSGKTASGKDLPPVAVAWGKNLINWSIQPRDSKPSYVEHSALYFDFDQAEWVAEKVAGKDDAKAKKQSHVRKSTKDEASKSAKAEKDGAERAAGSGTVVMDGEDLVFAGAPLNLQGAGPGADGTYRIKSCTETLNSSGWIISNAVEQPKDGAGTDKRKPSAKSPTKTKKKTSTPVSSTSFAEQWYGS